MVTQTNAVHHTGDFRAQEMQEKAIVEVAVCINLEAWHLASNRWLWKGVGVVTLGHYQTCQVSVESPAQPKRMQ